MFDGVIPSSFESVLYSCTLFNVPVINPLVRTYRCISDVAVTIKINLLTNTDIGYSKVGHWPPVDGNATLKGISTLFGVDQVVAKGVASRFVQRLLAGDSNWDVSISPIDGD